MLMVGSAFHLHNTFFEKQMGVRILNSAVIRKRCDVYETEQLERHITDMLDGLEFNKKIELRDKKVLIKPNLVSPIKPEKGVTTHPVIVEAVIRYLLKAGVRDIGIGDSGMHGTEKIFSVTGMNEIARKYQCRICDFDRYETVNEIRSENRFLKEIPLTKYLKEADIVINIPKLKIHHAFMYTGAIKNIYGTVPGKNKLLIHAKAGNVERFEDILIDIFNTVQPTVHILDGIVGLEGNGPCNGTPIQTGLLLASYDAFALDVVACSQIGLDYKTIGYLNKYEKRKGHFSKASIQVIGDSVEKKEYDKPDILFKNLPNLIGKFLPAIYQYFKPVPRFSATKCKSCNICVETCPVKALYMDKLPVVDKKKCISCFCCQEACFSDAIVRSDAAAR